MYKVITFCPKDALDKVIDAMAKAGAGTIGNYSHCAFITEGQGNWYSGEGSIPTIGEVGKMSREPECRVEMICPDDKLRNVKEAIKTSHPYETPEIDIIKLYDFE